MRLMLVLRTSLFFALAITLLSAQTPRPQSMYRPNRCVFFHSCPRGKCAGRGGAGPKDGRQIRLKKDMASAICVLIRKSIRKPIFVSLLSPNNSLPWPLCCSCTTGSFLLRNRLTEVFPEFPAYGKNITIRNLLNHTSGLPDYSEIYGRRKKWRGQSGPPNTKFRMTKFWLFWKLRTGGEICAWNALGIQQFRLCRIGLIVAKASGHALSGVSAAAHLHSAENGSHHCLSKGQKRNQQSRLRTLQRKRQARGNRSKRYFGNARRRRHLFQCRGSCEMGRRPSQSHSAQRTGISARTHAGKTCGWKHAALARVHTTTDSHPSHPRCLRLRLVSRSLRGHARIYHDGGTMGFRNTIQRFVDDHFTS